MYWHVKWDQVNYRSILEDGMSYSSKDYLEISDEKLPIDEDIIKYYFSSKSNLAIPDFPAGVTLGVLICRPQTWKPFSVLNLGADRKYTGYIGKDKYKIVCCLNEINGFDYDNSIYSRFPFDERSIKNIKKLILSRELSTDLDVFRLRDEWRTRFELIVSQRFKNIYDDNGLTGLLFHSAHIETH